MPKYIALPTGEILDVDGIQTVSKIEVARLHTDNKSFIYGIEIEIAGCKPIYMEFDSEMTREIVAHEILYHLNDEDFYFHPSGLSLRLRTIRYVNREGALGLRFIVDRYTPTTTGFRDVSFETQEDRDAAMEDLTHRLLLLNT